MSERTVGPIPPSFVVDLGARIYANVMSSTNADATLVAIKQECNLAPEATVGDCAKILAKNCLDHARIYAEAAGAYLLEIEASKQ